LSAAARADVVTETVPLDGRALEIVRPRDPEALLDEEAFDHEEFLPYWAELWPSALALARALTGRALRGARTVELGCGLGLPSIAAALAGARVLATDWSPDAIAFTAENARRNDAAVQTAIVDWQAPAALLERAPFDLVIASDVLYERRNGPLLLDLLPRLGDEVWIADPGRRPADAFLEAARADWQLTSRPDRAHPSVRLHRLRRRRPGA
jgi:predicted nicotinamide N-methyase